MFLYIILHMTIKLLSGIGGVGGMVMAIPIFVYSTGPPSHISVLFHNTYLLHMQFFHVHGHIEL